MLRLKFQMLYPPSNCTVLILVNNSNLSTVICAAASIQISQDFNSHSDFFAIFYITVWNLGEAIAPLYIGPLSERSGRLKVYHFYNVLFIIFTAVTGFSNSIGMIVAFRFLTGMSTTSICLNPSIVGDMYSLESRGAAMSIMSLMPLVGTAVGPIIGGYVTQRMSWRWTFWLTAILTGIVEITIIIVFRETYTPHILRQRKKAQAKSSTSELGEKMRESKVKARKSPFAALRFLLKPFPLLLSSRSATIISLYLSVVYAYLFLFAANLATVFQEVYLFSESNSGLVYLGLGEHTGAHGLYIDLLLIDIQPLECLLERFSAGLRWTVRLLPYHRRGSQPVMNQRLMAGYHRRSACCP